MKYESMQIGSLLNTMIIYMGVTETESPTFLFVLENVRSIQILCSTLSPALIGMWKKSGYVNLNMKCQPMFSGVCHILNHFYMTFYLNLSCKISIHAVYPSILTFSFLTKEYLTHFLLNTLKVCVSAKCVDLSGNTDIQ